MFEMSDQVVDVFAAQSELRFHDRLVDFLVEQFPNYADDRRAVSALVRLGVSDAENLGLRSERALAMYCLLVLLLGLEIKDDLRLKDLLLQSGQNEVDLANSMGEWIKGISAALEGE